MQVPEGNMSEFRYGERLFLMIQNPHVIKKKKKDE